MPRQSTIRLCSIDGCEEHVHGRGWCAQHYERWTNHGDPLGGVFREGNYRRNDHTFIIGTRKRNPEYEAWLNMKQRCRNTTARWAEHYSGRGIVVCERWRFSFEAFLEDVGPRPSPKHSLDRRDNDGSYEPGNVRWATPSEQQTNRRSWTRR